MCNQIASVTVCTHQWQELSSERFLKNPYFLLVIIKSRLAGSGVEMEGRHAGKVHRAEVEPAASKLIIQHLNQ